MGTTTCEIVVHKSRYCMNLSPNKLSANEGTEGTNLII